jgi:ubiquinone/menaquinone biosynthesis C-methylase UbiE
VERAGQLAAARGLANVDFRVMNALAMDFPDDSFDLVWACESGEHMPDKKAYVEEMVRVLKPGALPPNLTLLKPGARHTAAAPRAPPAAPVRAGRLERAGPRVAGRGCRRHRAATRSSTRQGHAAC